MCDDVSKPCQLFVGTFPAASSRHFPLTLVASAVTVHRHPQPQLLVVIVKASPPGRAQHRNERSALCLGVTRTWECLPQAFPECVHKPL